MAKGCQIVQNELEKELNLLEKHSIKEAVKDSPVLDEIRYIETSVVDEFINSILN